MTTVTAPPFERVLRRSIRNSDGCWIWTGATVDDRNGVPKYGVVGIGRKRIGIVHRVVYEALIAEIPPGQEIHHTCRNTRCVNPEHMVPVTRQQHHEIHKAERTHCRAGHPLDDIYINPAGKRRCNHCRRLVARASYHRRRVAA